MFHACSGIQAAHSLRFAGYAASVIAKQSMLVTKLEQEGWYSGIPVADPEGRVVLILSMLHNYAITELPGYQDFIPATLGYLQYMLYAHASQEH